MKMKKNERQVSSFTRAMNSDERHHLTYLLKQVMSPRKRLLKAILNSFVIWGFLLVVLLLFAGVISYLAQYSVLISSLLNFPYLEPLMIISSAVYALFCSYQWLQVTENAYPVILQDIEAGEVIDECYHVQQVCRFQEPELGGFIYFLKISAQDIFVIYDYQSQGDHNSNFVLKTQLTLARSPQSNYQLMHYFSGEKISISETYPLTVAPEKWPVADNWLSLPWSQLPLTFSPKHPV